MVVLVGQVLPNFHDLFYFVEDLVALDLLSVLFVDANELFDSLFLSVFLWFELIVTVYRLLFIILIYDHFYHGRELHLIIVFGILQRLFDLSQPELDFLILSLDELFAE